MAVSLKHTTQAVGTDAGNGEIRKAQWNEEHTLTAAANTLLGAVTAGAVGEVTCTAAGRALLDDADAAAQRTTLGLGTANSPSFAGLTLTGAGVLSAGTVTAPALAPTGDSNTGLWFPAAGTMAFSTGGLERVRIDSSGTLSIAGGAGTLSSTQIYWASSTAFQPQINLLNSNDGTTGPIWATDKSRGGTTPANSGDQLGQFLFRSYNSSGALSNAAQMQAVSAGVTTTGHAGILRWVTRNTSDSYSERMRIDGAGNLGINTTAPDALLSVNGIASIGAGAAATPSLAGFGDLNTGMWFPAADTIAWSTGGTERMRIDSSGNVGIGTSSFGTSAAKVLAIANGTAPTAGPADTIQIYSTDLSAGNTMLSLYTEGTPVNANTTAAATHRIAIRVNGTVYYLLANTSA